MIEAKMLDWFDYRGAFSSSRLFPSNSPLEFRLYQWLRSNTLDRLSSTFGILEDPSSQLPPTEEVWKERKDAEANIKAYLADLPGTS